MSPYLLPLFALSSALPSYLRFALRAAPSLMIECASHFEAKGELEKAVQLFYKVRDPLTRSLQ